MRDDPAADATAAGLHRHLVETSQDGIFVLDGEGLVTFCNRRFADLVGRRPDELLGTSAALLLDAQGRVQFAEHLAVMRSGAPGASNEEALLHRPDGSPVWTLTTWHPLHDDDGALLGYAHRVIEYAAHRQRLDRLQERGRQLATAQSISGTGSWELRLDTGTVRWSDQMGRIFGREDSLGIDDLETAVRTFVHPDDRPAVLEVGGVEELGRLPQPWEGRIVRPDGTVRWVRARWRYDELDPAWLRGTVEDITEIALAAAVAARATADVRLLREIAQAANGASSLPEAIEAGMPALAANSTWRALGYHLADADGGLVWHPLDPAARPSPSDHVAPTVADGALRAAPAPDHPGHHVVQVPVLRGGQVVCVVEVLSGTDQPDDSLPMATQVAALLGQVAERAHAADELAQARDEAMAASRQKTAFLATMSHEIRTPMNGVIGLCELLLGTPLDERQQRLAENLQSTGRTLLGIINDILDLSKIESGSLELAAEELAPRDVLDRAAGILAGPAAARGLELAVWCEPDVPALLLGDAVRLEQVVVNLGFNAVKFTERGGITIRIATEPPGATTLRIEVTDTGIGIPAEAQRRLFEAFAQADSSPTRRHDGTGLGLAICSRLAEQMGGCIGVDSAPGRGSTFWVTARLGAPGGEAARVHPPSSQPGLAERRVLVVADTDRTGRAVAAQLAAWGGSATVVPGLPEATTARRDAEREGRPFAVVVLDLDTAPVDVAPVRALTDTDADTDADAGAPAALVVLAAQPGVPDRTVDALSAVAGLAKPVRHSELLGAVRSAAGLRPAPTRPAGRPPRARAGTRVLVAEDNEVNQLVARGYLERIGIEVEIAVDGQEALERVTDADAPRLDAVLMDCRMPRLDGLAATRAIRVAERRRSTARVPVIAMTASVLDQERDRCLEAGMDDFLSKPVEPVQLERALARWVPGIGVAPTEVRTRAGAEGASAPPVLDLDRVEELGELVKDGVSFFVRIRASFLARIDATLQQLRADAALPGEALVSSAHALKGSAGNLGLARLADAARTLEELARAGASPDELTEPLGSLDELAREAVEALASVPG